MSFSGVDFLGIEDMLSEDEKAVRDLVRDFVDAEVLPIIEACAYEGRFPKELIPQMAAMNLFGSTIHEYGLPGLNNVAYGLITQELERGDSGLRSFVSVQSALVMFPIYTYGSKEQKDRWIPALAKGEAIGCFGLTEPDFGSNPAGMRTVAKKDGKDWILNGAKAWITNGSIADVAVVWAKVGGDDGPIRGFLVEKGTKGFTAPEHRMKMSLRASVTSQLAFEDVPPPRGRPSSPASRASRGPSPASRRPATASPGAGSARRWRRTRARSTTRSRASSSRTARSRPTSSSSRSSRS